MQRMSVGLFKKPIKTINAENTGVGGYVKNDFASIFAAGNFDCVNSELAVA